jgi:hypothetical protein
MFLLNFLIYSTKGIKEEEERRESADKGKEWKGILKKGENGIKEKKGGS